MSCSFTPPQRFPALQYDIDDVILPILDFLPDATLVLMQCVSPQWQHTVRQPCVWHNRGAFRVKQEYVWDVERFTNSFANLPIRHIEISVGASFYPLIVHLTRFARLETLTIRCFNWMVATIPIIVQDHQQYRIWVDAFFTMQDIRRMSAVNFTGCIEKVELQEDVPLQGTLPQVRCLRLLFKPTNLETMQRLAGEYPNMQMLDLCVPQFDARGWEPLMCKPSLRTLKIHWKTGELGLLRNCDNIENLAIRIETRSSIGAVMETVSQMPSLKNLMVYCHTMEFLNADDPRLRHALAPIEAMFITLEMDTDKQFELPSSLYYIPTLRRLLLYVNAFVNEFDTDWVVDCAQLAEAFPNVRYLSVVSLASGSYDPLWIDSKACSRLRNLNRLTKLQKLYTDLFVCQQDIDQLKHVFWRPTNERLQSIMNDNGWC